MSFSGRIVGGMVAAHEQFPYQISLRTFLMQRLRTFLKFFELFLIKIISSHFCGGFIITDRWMGTAGKKLLSSEHI